MARTKMAHRCIIFFFHLLISLLVSPSEMRKNSVHGVIEQLPDHGEVHKGHDHLSHIGHQMDPSVVVFFLLADLKKGATMEIYFPKREKFGSPSSPPLLTKEEADKIPFSSDHLTSLLQRFSFPPSSPQAIAMENALRQCETKPMKGEIKFCATSLDSMLNFSEEIFGLETHVEVLSTIHPTGLKNTLQRYTISEEPHQILAPKMVACHTMPYPYAVFYCHYQESESRVYKVSLMANNGDEVIAIAVCHMDTSQWSRNHVSFSVLRIEPGESPICHFFPADHLVLVPSHSTQFAAAAA